MKSSQFYTTHCGNIAKRPILATLLASVLKVDGELNESELFFLFIIDNLFDIPYLDDDVLIPFIMLHTSYLQGIYPQIIAKELEYPVISIINFKRISLDGQKWIDMRTGRFDDEMPLYPIHAATVNLINIFEVFSEVIQDGSLDTQQADS